MAKELQRAESRKHLEIEQAATNKIYELRHGRRLLARIVPAGQGLYKIHWPDALSAPANLSRCKDAALAWAEQIILSENRNFSVARRLKSLSNFFWSSPPISQNAAAGVECEGGA
jgi:hypothetical protein